MISKIKLSKKMVAIALVSALLIACLCGGLNFTTDSTRASAAVWENVAGNVEIDESYYIDTVFSAPDMDVKQDDITVRATHRLVFPDQSEVSDKDIKLDMLGKYRLIYSALINGTKLEKEFVFNVYEQLYSFSGIGNTASYGKYKPTATKEGLIVSMTQNSALTFNAPIDLKNMTAADSIFELFATPSVLGSEDFGKFKITLTDIHNEANILTITIRDSAGGASDKLGAYALAGGVDQALTGYEPTWDRVHRNNEWGSYLLFSFYGAKTPLENEVISLRLDYATKILYSQNDQKIIDLDSPDFFSTLWEGFTTGEARLKICPQSFAKEKANFVITSLAGHDLSKNIIQDNLSPKIAIDFDGNDSKNLPYAKVGTPYKIFPAVANDKYAGKCKITTKVRANYLQANETEVKIVNNQFTPTEECVYTIIYSASDAYGNEGINDTVNVIAKNDIPKVKITALVTGSVNSGYVGTQIDLARFVVNGGSGKISVLTTVVGGNCAEIVTGEKFIPQVDGNYTIVYKATDYLGQVATTSYNISVNYSPDPLFFDEANLPKYFISGHEYTLPKMFARKHSKNGVEIVEASTSVKLDGKADVALGADNKTLIQTENANGKAVITYYAGNKTKVYTRDIINVKKNNKLDLSRYFACDSGVSATGNSNAVLVSATQDGGVEFIKDILGESFNIVFEADTSKTKFNAVSFYFTDISNENNVIKVTYRKTEGIAKVSINDGRQFDADAGFTSAAKNNEFSLKIVGKKVLIGNIANYAQKNMAGENFEGFKNGLIYLSVKFEGVKENAAIGIKTINGQPMNGNLTKDNIAPSAAALNDVSGTYKEGQSLTLPHVVASDVLDPNISLNLTVTFKPLNGDKFEVIKDASGKLLKNVAPNGDYKLIFSKCGIINVQYVMMDTTNGQQSFLTYNIIIQDTKPPIITVNKEPQLVTKAALGESVFIPRASASDDSGEEIKVYTYLVTTKGKLIEVSDINDAFVADSVGVYYIRYMAFDNTGNVTILNCPIIVA